jgi:histone deacetylase 6
MKADCIGEGAGKYFNVNVAWETGKVVDEVNRDNNILSDLGNDEYKLVCDTVLFPMVREFKPDIILVSCGFDGAVHDFLGWSNLSPIMYAYMTNSLI